MRCPQLGSQRTVLLCQAASHDAFATVGGSNFKRENAYERLDRDVAGTCLFVEDEAGQEAKGPSILVIDDNDDVREYLRGHLAGLYTVLQAADGTEGLEKAYQHLPDLILADIMMPGTDGYELCRKLEEDDRTAHIPIIMPTEMASEDAELEGLEAGADDYMSKPFSAGALLARVENLIEIRRLLRMGFTDKVTIASTGVTVESADAAFLASVRDVTEGHLDDGNFSVEWLAGEVGVSTRTLRRITRTGKPFARRLRENDTIAASRRTPRTGSRQRVGNCLPGRLQRSSLFLQAIQASVRSNAVGLPYLAFSRAC